MIATTHHPGATAHSKPVQLRDLVQRRTDRHYVRSATGPRHFFDFSEGKLERYIEEYGDDFCLVILCSTQCPGDVYVIPFPAIRHMLTPAALANDSRRRAPRWTGKIEGGRWLRIDRCPQRLALWPFHTRWSGD